MENEKITNDELNMLVGTLTLVVDDLKATLRREITDDNRTLFLQKGNSDGKK
jgi:hypothetical protein